MTKVLPLVYFTHAELKSSENLNASIDYIENTNATKTPSFGKSVLKGKKRLKLSLKDDNMCYEALEEDEQPFMVGLFDKASGNISLCQTPYFLLKPQCCISSTQENNENLSVDQNATYSEKLNSLTAAFGSSKKRKAMQTKLKNKIDTETLETAVEVAVEESKKMALNKPEVKPNEHEPESNLEQFSIMPVPNKEAKTPNEVYAINEALAISQPEFERFTLELSKKFAIATSESIKTWKENSVYPEFITQFLTKLASSKSNQKYRLEKCKQLVYMNYLLQLYRLKAAQLRAKTPMATCELPDSARNKLFHLYTVESNSNAQAKSVRSMPRRLKDKLTCHILVLALHIDDFSTSLDLLQKDLKISLQRLSDFYQALGCFVRSQVAVVNKKKVVCKIANLTLPLNDISKAQPKKKARKN